MAAERARAAAWIALCAVVPLGLSFALFSDVDLNLADEGFLWDGVLRTLQGQVPVRDIQSYLPARYYWCAAWLALLGPGVMALRLAVCVFAAGGLALGLAAAGRALPAAALPVLSVVLVSWLWPPHKLFEPALAMAAVWFVLRLIERPDGARHLQAGLGVGLAACFERNHALYWTLAVGAAALFVAWKRPAPGLVRRFGMLLVGVALGLVPLVLFALLVPGFWEALVDETRLFFGTELNQNLPYPWPWRTRWEGLPANASLGKAFLSACFLLPVVVPPLAIVAGLTARGEAVLRRAPLFAAGLVAAAYAHHVAGRSDAQHLAQVIQPSWIALFALPAAFAWRPRAAWALCLALVPVAFLGTRDVDPCLVQFKALPKPIELRRREIQQDVLRLPPWTLFYVNRAQAAIEQHVPAGAKMFCAPFLVTVYPLVGRTSPVRETYFLRPLSREAQERMLADLERQDVRWAWVTLGGLDNREDLELRATAPLVWAWLQREFEAVPSERLPPGNFLLRKRDGR